MNKLGLALGLLFAGVVAAPGLADGLTFEPVTPEGLDASATEIVAALQGRMPGQMAAFEQQGYGAYGAMAVPVGVALEPETFAYWVGMSVTLASVEDARNMALEDCENKNGMSCTVIGLLVPADN